MSQSLLRLERASKNFGGLRALNNVSFDVPAASIKAMIGPNGAGKTTAFNLISGVHLPSGGRIYFDGRRIDGVAPHNLSRLGLARTFQTVKLFTSLTVFENIMVGCHAATAGGVLRCIMGGGRVKRDENAARSRAAGILELVGLSDKKDLLAGELPFGPQRLVEIARALATSPRLLLLDEPAAGLSAGERTNLRALIRSLRDEGLTVLLIEHDMRMVMDLADEVVVLEYGSVLAEGSPREIQSHPEVIRAYLGACEKPEPKPRDESQGYTGKAL